MESGVKDEKPLALRTWSLNGGVIRIQLTRLADFADGDAIHGAIHAFTKALAGSRAPSDAALVEALEDRAEAAEAEAVRLRGVVEMISRMKRDIDPGINITTLSAAIQLSQAALTPPSEGE